MDSMQLSNDTYWWFRNIYLAVLWKPEKFLETSKIIWLVRLPPPFAWILTISSFSTAKEEHNTSKLKREIEKLLRHEKDISMYHERNKKTSHYHYVAISAMLPASNRGSIPSDQGQVHGLVGVGRMGQVHGLGGGDSKGWSRGQTYDLGAKSMAWGPLVDRQTEKVKTLPSFVVWWMFMKAS